MTVTVLIDLDDTLLINDMDRFLPAYLKGLSEHVSQRVDPALFIQQLLQATDQMTAKSLPLGTLEETFDRHFYPALGIEREGINAEIEDFYARKFPELRSLTRQNPAAINLIQEFFRRGWQVVIATNPVFPRTAILQRLEWAGLPVDHFPFILIPSFETMHFAKPHPAYFAELLGQIGWPDGLAVMVGNSLSDDIQPANRLGLPTFHVIDTTEKNNLPANCAAGGLDQTIPWIESLLARDIPPFTATPEAWLAVLGATPAALQTRTHWFDRTQWNASPAPGEWNPVQILCHLRDVDAEVNLPRIRRILAEDSPLLTGIDTDGWAESRHYAEQSGPDAAAAFMQTRMEMLHLLVDLSSSDWQRACRHTIFSRTTLAELVSFMATHDRSHLQQLCRAVECRQSPGLSD